MINNVNSIKTKIEIGSTLYSIVIYLGGGIIGKIIPFLLLPVLTRYLDPEDFGLYATYQSVFVLITAFVGINLNGAIIRGYTKLEINEFPIYLYSCMVLLFFSFIFVVFVLSVFGTYISKLTKIPYPWLMLIPVIAAGAFLYKNILSIFRVEEKPITFSIWNVLYSLLNLILAVVLVVVFHFDWRGMVISIAFANLTLGTAGLFLLLKKKLIKIKASKSYLMDAILFGSPLIIHHLSTWAGSMLNRPLLSQFAGLEATGLFYTAFTIASVITVFDAAVEQAWTPWLYRKLNNKKIEEKIQVVKVTYLYIVFLLILVLILSSATKFILPWALGDRFSGAADYVFLVALARAFTAMKRSVFGYALFENKSYLIGYITFITTIIGVLLNFLLIKNFGLMGAAYAMVGSNFLSFVLTWLVANHASPMPWLLINTRHS